MCVDVVSGNPCEVDCDGHGSTPRYFLIKFLSATSLKSIDDLAVDFNERESAIRTVDKLPAFTKNDVLARVNWSNVRQMPRFAQFVKGLSDAKAIVLNDRYHSEKRGRCDAMLPLRSCSGVLIVWFLR